MVPGRRRKAFALPVLAAVVLGACAQSAPPLNSERIEQRYGDYRVRVLCQSGARRISSLESRHGERRVTRTLAIVHFEQPRDPALASEHERIVRGASIGATFRAAGWSIAKPLLHTGMLAIESETVLGLMGLSSPARLAVHVYRFDVSRGTHTRRYATIAELHHPDYLTPADLHRIYGRSPGAAGARRDALEQWILRAIDSLPAAGIRLEYRPSHEAGTTP